MGAKAMSSHGIGAGGGGPLSQQGSVCSLTFSEVDGQLSIAAADKRTVDEVWRDIQGAGVCPRSQMTLEDFLSRAGAPADAAYTGARSWAQQYQPAPAQLDHHQHYPMPRPLGMGAGPVLDALYHESHEGGAAAGRKRAVGAEGGVVERSTVERRKKRMIKNRESAARSRARKQAYTNELENKISRLEEENERLRRHKAPEPVVQYVPQLEIKNQLRRTNSANF
ncbi:ABSCISIC ACID-INSENSITIVE 5-like protein 2 [Phragmites australis]|uniref:ABSCISIC ACID-INSENSITIVE 5-like protein 2 n=1 Tax=Phragmites australis TaxID=29695 RepID=UPI002D792945|nr:ABSCISIC ACID-INSENSITIVE 5-like protein 2 [Phragmites australis]